MNPFGRYFIFCRHHWNAILWLKNVERMVSYSTSSTSSGTATTSSTPSVIKKKIINHSTSATAVLTPSSSSSSSSSAATTQLAQTIINNNLSNTDQIPGPKGLPIFGTMFDLIAAGSAPQLHKYIDKRHQQYGPIFCERLGGVNQKAIFISSASLMRSLFIHEGQYPKHPIPDSWTLYNQKHKCQRGLFFMNGPEWLHNRRIMNRLLLHGNCNWINLHIMKSTNKLINNWKKLEQNQYKEKLCELKNNDDNFVEIQNLESQLYRWSIDVLTSLMFGNEFDRASKELVKKINEFSCNVHKIFESSSNLMNFPSKIAQIFKMKIWTDFEKNTTNVLEMGNNVIDECIAEIGYGSGLLNMMQKNNMPMIDIRRIFVDLIIAAGDTTAFSTQWSMFVLAQSEEIQSRIRSECFAIEKNSLIEIPYIKGLLKETLRLFPVAPFIGRFLANDAIIGNYKVDRNSLVLLSLYTSGRNADYFPEPLKIKPERWLRQNNGDLLDVLQANGSLPFAIGSRSCIGRKIALSQMHTLIKLLISNFKLKCLNAKEIDVVLRLVAVPDQPIRLAIKTI